MIVIAILYVGLVFVSCTNWLLMKRPRGNATACFEVMIPARNEVLNLPTVITPLVKSEVKVTIFDDESTDGTAELAESLGATVICPLTSLPDGWTGKNNACHQLSINATAPWTVFLDADTIPDEAFASQLSSFLEACDDSVKVVSGFPRMIPGKGVEPAYLSWVTWILLATNPFGLVSATSKGHNRFTNGQFGAWRTAALHDIRPYEQVRSEVLEDVKIGRLLGRLGVRVENIVLGDILSVRMYGDTKEAINGMSKNSADIMGSTQGSLGLSALLLIIAWGWALCGSFALPLYGILILGKLITDRVVRASIWTFPFAPLTITAGALTILRSILLKRNGRITWKERSY